MSVFFGIPSVQLISDFYRSKLSIMIDQTKVFVAFLFDF